METKDLGKTSTGIQANMAALLSYLAGWITGLIFFLVEKENKFVRFHAMQSILASGGLSSMDHDSGILIICPRYQHIFPMVVLRACLYARVDRGVDIMDRSNDKGVSGRKI